MKNGYCNTATDFSQVGRGAETRSGKGMLEIVVKSRNKVNSKAARYHDEVVWEKVPNPCLAYSILHISSVMMLCGFPIAFK